MFETLNRALFAFVSGTSAPTGALLAGAIFIAEWLILTGPVLLVVLWIFGSTGDRRAAVGAGLSAILAVAIAATLSILVWHPRPFMDGLAANYLNHAADSSFPSDHATQLFALGFSLWLMPSLLLPRAWIAMMGLGLAVGWARVYLGVHYPFDIFGAALVGLSSALVFATSPGRRASGSVTQIAEWLYGLVLDRMRLRKHL